MRFRNAMPDDAAAMAVVDRSSWPPLLATTEAEFKARIEVFPEGQVVAESSRRIVGSDLV